MYLLFSSWLKLTHNNDDSFTSFLSFYNDQLQIFAFDCKSTNRFNSPNNNGLLQICAPKAVVYGVRKGGSGCVKGVRGASGASGVHFG